MSSPLGALTPSPPRAKARGFFLDDLMNRVAFLVDGFNVYHSVRDAETAIERRLQWLDIRGLCRTYVRRLLGKDAALKSVTYFTAYATFLAESNPIALVHHKTYVRALEATGVQTVLGRFKSRSRKCPKCGTSYTAHEEKETDVAIALQLVELAISPNCDTIVIITGDTDIVPAVRAARQLAPGKRVWIASPYHRHNRELWHHAHRGFKISAEAYLRHQLPDPVVAPDGTLVPKPATW